MAQDPEQPLSGGPDDLGATEGTKRTERHRVLILSALLVVILAGIIIALWAN